MLSNYLKPLISISITCGHMAANRSRGRAAKFMNIGRDVVVASKSGLVETKPIIPMATALLCTCFLASFNCSVVGKSLNLSQLIAYIVDHE